MINPQPILSASLPPGFREIRLTLATESEHPASDPDVRYVFIAPLGPDGRIDAVLWKRHREACRVVRSRSGAPDVQGHLIHRPGGSWAFHYENIADDVGFHFTDEQFHQGECVSIREAGKFHRFEVAFVRHF